MIRQNRFLALAAGLSLAAAASIVHAAPYASGIQVSGTTVTYIMNQDSDVLEISINGGAFAAAPDGTLKGTHTFNLGLPTDTFAIRADRTESGWAQADGGSLVRGDLGIGYDTATSFGTLISSDANNFNKYNSPRGISVSMNPNAPNFGNAYISNSAAGAVGGRTLTGDGVYAVKADQTDAYGFGDAAQGTTVFGAAASANTPYKVTVASSGNVYVAGFGDGVSGLFEMPHNLSSVTTVLAGTTGPTALPPGQNHGSVTASYVTGSTATGDLTVYTLDEDLSTLQVTGSGSGVDTNKLWQYTIGGGSLPHSAMPTAVASPLIPGFSIVTDVDRGADGKWYLAQNRSQPANSTGLFVTDASGNVLFDSQRATAAIKPISTTAGDYNHDGVKTAGDYVIWRKQQGTAGPDADGNGDATVDAADYEIWRNGNPALTGGAIEAGFGDLVNDMYSNIFAIAVSSDQKWLAALHNNNAISLTPLVAGIPDIANRLAIQGGATTLFTARDIAFDAAGNIHFVSSGLGLYRVLAPGGHTIATTSWNGTTYAFNITTQGSGSGSLGGAVPEPGTLLLAVTGVFLACAVRRRR